MSYDDPADCIVCQLLGTLCPYHAFPAHNVVPGRLIDLWVCPTTGRIIEGLIDDDKVLCGCRRSNPLVLAERTEQTGTHIKRFLRPASEADWRAQSMAETRR